VIYLAKGADNNIIRRVCAWDAKPDDDNNSVWGIHYNTGNTLEDVCGFGTGRKIFSNSQGGNNLTIRRAWGRWERNLNVGPKLVFAIAYNSYNAIFENVIGNWDGEASNAYGILTMDRLDGPNYCANSKFLGSIAYIRNSDTPAGVPLRTVNSVDCLDWKDNVTFLDTNHSSRIAIDLGNVSATKIGYAPATKHILRNTTNIGGTSKIGSDWTVTERVSGSTVQSVPSIWNGAGTNGARVCKRYVNGVLTTTPLWPWPMNQRIIDAMRAAGKSPVDVTKTMEEIFGSIPSECRNGSITSTALAVPPSPGNLSAGAIQ
jgi:hypothetical protein